MAKILLASYDKKKSKDFADIIGYKLPPTSEVWTQKKKDFTFVKEVS